MRLIDADALMESFRKYMMENYDKEKCISAENCEICGGCLWAKITKKPPTIEATPVVHGRWMLEGSGHTHYCDRCHDYYTTDADSLYFCPRCGAKMIGVEQPGRNGWKMELVDGELKQVWGVIKERFVKTRTEADFPNCGARMDKED